jgi:hypothetical protein
MAHEEANRDRQRAAQNQPGSKARASWEKEAVIDDQRADDYEKEALRLESDAVIEEARAAAAEARAAAFRQGIDSSSGSGLQAKLKAATEARAAYNECAGRSNADCPVRPGKFSLSLGLEYSWDRPRLGPEWPPLPPRGGGLPGGGIRIQTKDEPPNPTAPKNDPTPSRPEEKCHYTLTDGWFEPTQGVWQDDDKFPDRPGKQLTRLDIPGVVSYLAELPMVRDRDTVITGAHHYNLNGKQVLLNRRIWVTMKGLSDCTEFDSVTMRFTGVGAAQGVAFDGPGGQIRLHGKKRPEMEPWEVSGLAELGIPAQNFKFGTTGPYTLIAELIAGQDGTGMQVLVSGNVVDTQGPMVHFFPVILQAGSGNTVNDATAQSLAMGSSRYLPDLFPLKPSGLPTQAHPLKDFTGEDIPSTWDFYVFYRKESKLVSLLQDHLGASAFLTGAGRVVAILSAADFQMLEGRDVAGKAPEGTFSLQDSGTALSFKVILVGETSGIHTVGHELVHTLPGLWSSDQMVEECGIDYHNQDHSLANGLRLVAGGVASGRRRKDLSTPLMGPSYGPEHDEDLANPLVGTARRERMVKDPDTGQTVNRSILESWITQCTYRHLANVLMTPPDPPMLLVRGYLGRHNGKYSVFLNSFYDVMGHEDLPVNFAGDFAIVLQDASGGELARYKFSPDWKLPGFGLTRDLTAFAFRVPLTPRLSQITINGPDGVLATRKIATQLPTVEILSPEKDKATVLQDGKIQVSWRGRSPGGAPLLYTVLYSADGGDTWDERVFEKPATQARISIQPKSKNHAIKIIASDSSRSSEAVVHFITP